MFSLSLIVTFIIGLFAGSVLSIFIYRLPGNNPVIRPGSFCPSCGTGLKTYDMIPVISYFLIKGKCRYCGNRIAPRYPVVELVNALIYTALFLKFGVSVDFFSGIYIMSILIVVFFIDLEYKIIPDELVLAGLAGGILLFAYNLFRPVQLYGDRHWWNPLLGILSTSGIMLVVAIIGIIIYKSDDAMGMGDVKILAPIGMFLGYKLGLFSLVLDIVIGGLAGIVLILTQARKRKDAIPFGPFIVTGTFVSMMWGWDIINWYISKL